SRQHCYDQKPQPRSNTKNNMVPSASNSSCIKNKEVKVEEHHTIVYAMCKQCLINANHDVCVLKYVNDMNSCGDKHSANASKTANTKKHKPKGKKPKNVGFKERHASPKPSKPRSCLRWSPTRRRFDLKGKIIESSKSERQSDNSKGDNACISNPQEPTRKRFLNSSFSMKGTVHFENDHIAAILGYGDLQWGNILITRVYFVEGLGHNLFLVGQSCDSDLEVALRRNTCFVRNLEGVDLLIGIRTTTFTPSNLNEMAYAFQFDLWARAILQSRGYRHSTIHLNTMYDDYIGGQPSAALRTAHVDKQLSSSTSNKHLQQQQKPPLTPIKNSICLQAADSQTLP
ncbi:hypothetical protein Tco_0574231, partial [Tanacetum coccineum]